MAKSRLFLFNVFVCCAFGITSWAQSATALSPTIEHTPTKYTFRFPLGTPTSAPSTPPVLHPINASTTIRPSFATEVLPMDTRTWNVNSTVGFRSRFSMQDVPVPFCSLPTQGAAFSISGRDVFLPCLADRLLQWAVQSVINR
ncbi:hypothetical protein [Flavobacterium sp.]|jgi:hypothetical protein|uniref:hypothetical protein n=1 Tax=Flavobacterium sp. TaxID=239 RepID=UPI0022CA03AD|nr:hypothetical protein [Flavobacterium sp.]MCZ8145190.1 hypothetical protein [Flavobacterium sp.]MCZ8367190.1 hypothetical protein [Flavobacterium sp.]